MKKDKVGLDMLIILAFTVALVIVTSLVTTGVVS